MNVLDRYRAEVDAGYGALSVAEAFADDGAFATAADKLREAAGHFRDAALIKNEALNKLAS